MFLIFNLTNYKLAHPQHSPTTTELELILRAKVQIESAICTSARHDAVSQCSSLIALVCLLTCTRDLLRESNISVKDVPTPLLKWEKNILEGLISVVNSKLDRWAASKSRQPQLPMWLVIASFAIVT